MATDEQTQEGPDRWGQSRNTGRWHLFPSWAPTPRKSGQRWAACGRWVPVSDAGMQEGVPRFDVCERCKRLAGVRDE